MADTLDPSYAELEYFTEAEVAECRQLYENGGLEACTNFMNRKAKEWKEVPLNIALTGNVKTGKSSFINAIRGLTGDDEGAAKVGVVETTTESTPYAHPNNPMLKFWDLPGLGTPRFPRENYLELVGFAKYDFFLIMSSDTFTENDRWLATEIAAKQKRYFFVRTKLHQHILNDQHDHPKTHSSDKVIADITNNLKENLQKLYFPDIVFLIDNHRRKEYDFERLESRLLEDFPSLKREALILSMSAFSKDMVREKVKVLRGKIWRSGLVSGVGALAPLPGFSVALDLGIILHESKFFFEQLGLEEKSLGKMAEIMNCDVARLNKIVTAEWKHWLTMAGIQDLLIKIPAVALACTAEETVRLAIPVLGSVIAAPLSYYSTGKTLNTILTEMEKVALLMIDAAHESSSSQKSKECQEVIMGEPQNSFNMGNVKDVFQFYSTHLWPAALLSSLLSFYCQPIIPDLVFILAQSILWFYHLGLDPESLRKMAEGNMTKLDKIFFFQWMKWLALECMKVIMMKVVVLVPVVTAIGTFLFPSFGPMIFLAVSFLFTYAILDQLWKEMFQMASKLRKAAMGDCSRSDSEDCGRGWLFQCVHYCSSLVESKFGFNPSFTRPP